MEKEKTKFPGIRSCKHKARKHGVRYDECFFIRLVYIDQATGRRRETEEAAGWTSEGMSAEKAFKLRSQLRENIKRGSGPRSLCEMREQGELEREMEKAAVREEARRDILFEDFARDHYFPIAEPDWKPETARKHKQHGTTWLYPHLGDIPLRRINLAQINKVKAALHKAGRSPRTMQAVLRTFCMIWNAARDAEIVSEASPTKKKSFKLPKVDNERMRFLTAGEIQTLLDAVRLRNEQAAANSLVFPNGKGEVHRQVPSAFVRAMDDSGLNSEVDDPKLKATFHTTRHTFGSRMVQQGVDLYTLQKLMGHSTPVLTARYAKLADSNLREAVAQMERRERMKQKKESGKVLPLNKAGGG